jgi:hypothetical protein
MLRTFAGLLGALALVVAGRVISAPAEPPPPAAPHVVPDTVAALAAPQMPAPMPAPPGMPGAAQPARGG